MPTKKVKHPLSVTHPELVKEADGWNPNLVSYGSRQTLGWICSAGHQWNATPSHRTRGQGCPVCSGRTVLVGFNDLATTHPILAKQSDGWDPTKFSKGARDYLPWLCELGHKFFATIANRTGKFQSGCPYCSNKSVLRGYNDLATLYPLIASEAWEWDPETVTPGHSRKLTWKCSEGHFFKKAPSGRTGTKNRGCPVCSNFEILAGFNDLATTHPTLAAEAHNWDPTQVSAGARNSVLWRCSIGHIYQARVDSRTRKKPTDCPTCAKFGFDQNKSGWIYLLSHSQWNMFQIGITNVPDTRLSKHTSSGWTLLETRGPMEGSLARQWETAILRMLKAKGADLSNEKIAGKFDGYSEAWSKATFEVSSIKELMRLTEEFEKND